MYCNHNKNRIRNNGLHAFSVASPPSSPEHLYSGASPSASYSLNTPSSPHRVHQGQGGNNYPHSRYNDSNSSITPLSPNHSQYSSDPNYSASQALERYYQPRTLKDLSNSYQSGRAGSTGNGKASLPLCLCLSMSCLFFYHSLF